MAVLINAIGRARDIPQVEMVNLAGASAGSAYEHVIFTVPDLSQLSQAGSRPLMRLNSLTIRQVALVFEATVTGAATNNFTLNINQYRAGSAVSTSPIATITFGAGTNGTKFVPVYLKPTAGNKILGGDVLTLQNVQNGTGMAVPALCVGLDWLNAGFYE